MRPDGVELSVRIERPVLGSGDLVVRMRMESDLRARAGEHLATLELGGVPYGAVTIGGVTGIDANGQRCEGWLRHGPGQLDMVLPESFVDRAAWPIVVDPLIGGVTSAGVSFDDFQPDIAYDVASGNFTVVFEIRVSRTDTDVWAARIRGSDGVRLDATPIAVGSGRQMNPAIGNSRLAQRCVIAWQTDARGNWDIDAASFRPSSAAVSPAVMVAGSARDEIEPACGGEATTSDDDVLLAWQDVGGVGFRACQLTPASDTSPPLVFDFTDIPAPPQAGRIAITASGGRFGRYLLVWETRDAAGFYIGFRACDRNLTLDPGTFLQPAGGRELLFPQVDGDGQDCLIVCHRPETGGGTGFDVFGFHIDIRSQTPSSATGLFRIEAGDPQNELFPSVTWLGGDQFGVIWSEQIPNSPEREVRGRNYRRASREPCGRTFATSGNFRPIVTTRTACASMASAGGSGDLGLMAFEGEFVNTPGQHVVWYRRFEAIGSGGPITNLGGSCGLGGTASTSGGGFAMGNADFRLELRGANNGTLTGAYALLAIGASPNVFPCGPCQLLLPDVSVGPFAAIGGALTVPLPVSCDPATFGAVIHGQFAALTASASPCNLAAVSLSNRLRMVIGD